MPKFKRSVIDDLKNELAADADEEATYAARVRADLEELADEPLVEDESRDEKSAYDLIDEASAGLAHDGRDFIAALCWMATGAGFTAPSTRAFACRRTISAPSNKTQA